LLFLLSLHLLCLCFPLLLSGRLQLEGIVFGVVKGRLEIILGVLLLILFLLDHLNYLCLLGLLLGWKGVSDVLEPFGLLELRHPRRAGGCLRSR
jgi:hypothetical protein